MKRWTSILIGLGAASSLFANESDGLNCFLIKDGLVGGYRFDEISRGPVSIESFEDAKGCGFVVQSREIADFLYLPPSTQFLFEKLDEGCQSASFTKPFPAYDREQWGPFGLEFTIERRADQTITIDVAVGAKWLSFEAGVRQFIKCEGFTKDVRLTARPDCRVGDCQRVEDLKQSSQSSGRQIPVY